MFSGHRAWERRTRLRPAPCAGSYLQSAPVIWILNCGNGGTTPVIPGDPFGLTTVMRYWNWDTANGSTQCNASEVPTGISPYPNTVPAAGCSGGYPASFYLSGRPSWWPASIPFPAIGPDVTGGNVGVCGGALNAAGKFGGVAATNASQCAGQGLNAAWAGHVNAIPAMACYFLMGGPPDGSGGALTFTPSACYAGGTPTTATPAQGAPNFSGTYNVPPTVLPLSVTWTDSTPGASIFCTTDGSTPTPSSPAYAPYSLTHTTTIRCIATAPGFLNSGIGGGVWTIVSGAPAAPTNLTGTTSVTGSAIIQ